MRGRSRHRQVRAEMALRHQEDRDRKSTRLNSSHGYISYAVFCLKKKKKHATSDGPTPRRTTRCCNLGGWRSVAWLQRRQRSSFFSSRLPSPAQDAFLYICRLTY